MFWSTSIYTSVSPCEERQEVGEYLLPLELIRSKIITLAGYFSIEPHVFIDAGTSWASFLTKLGLSSASWPKPSISHLNPSSRYSGQTPWQSGAPWQAFGMTRRGRSSFGNVGHSSNCFLPALSWKLVPASHLFKLQSVIIDCGHVELSTVAEHYQKHLH